MLPGFGEHVSLLGTKISLYDIYVLFDDALKRVREKEKRKKEKKGEKRKHILYMKDKRRELKLNFYLVFFLQWV